jgi:hypothetical protein
VASFLLAQVEWRGSGAQRVMRLALLLRPSPAAAGAPGRTTRVELRWAWEWRGWRRLPGAAAAAHAAARAVAAQGELSIPAAFAAGRHTVPCALNGGIATAGAPSSPAVIAAEEAAAEVAAAAALAEDAAAVSAATWPGATDAEVALPEIHV